MEFVFMIASHYK